MSARLSAIRQRRAALLARAEAQRAEIARIVRPWRAPLSIADRVVAFVRRLRAHPLAIGAGLILLLWLGRSRKSLWAGRLWTLWQLYSTFRNSRQPGRQP
jgi:hypothetical protein